MTCRLMLDFVKHVKNFILNSTLHYFVRQVKNCIASSTSREETFISTNNACVIIIMNSPMCGLGWTKVKIAGERVFSRLSTT